MRNGDRIGARVLYLFFHIVQFSNGQNRALCVCSGLQARRDLERGVARLARQCVAPLDAGPRALAHVAESARAHSYYSSKQVQKTRYSVKKCLIHSI